MSNPVRVLVVSKTTADTRELAEKLATHDALTTDPVAPDEVLETLRAREVDCVVWDQTQSGLDDFERHEQNREQTDVVSVRVVDFEDWGRIGTRVADESTISLPKPQSGGFTDLGDCIRAAVHQRRGVTSRQRRLQTLLWELTDDVKEAPTRDAIVKRVCRRLACSEQFTGAWVCEQPPDPMVRATSGIEQSRVERLHDTLKGDPDAPWTRAADERTGHVYPETESAHDQEASEQLDVTLISVPLLHRGILYGVLNLSLAQPGSVTDLSAIIELLTSFGRTVGNALATAEMQAQGETVQQAIEQADPAIAILDENGTIEYVNAAFESVYGYAKSDAIGSTVGLLVPDSMDSSPLIEQVREDTPWRDEIVKRDKDGRQFYADLSVAAVPVEGGTRRKYVAVASDITSLKEREQRLGVLNRVLRHNLRNDMTAVNGYAEFLAKQIPEHRDYAVRIQELANDLVAISEKAREIEDVVATSQAEHTTSLSTVINNAVEDARDAHSECVFEVTLPDEDPSVDGSVLPSVLREVITNGVEHNDSETPRITIGATVRERERKQIEIRVSDNGPGIPDHELKPIREGTETALEHGSGLGLWLVRWGVTTMNGRIEFEDNHPHGTCVTIQFPEAR